MYVEHIAWCPHECDDLEVRQNGMGRWIWDVENKLIRGDTGWREREAKAMVKWMLGVLIVSRESDARYW